MLETPAHLAAMRALVGTREFPGSADNPAILGWRAEIARALPELGSYPTLNDHDATAWCGDTVAICMVRAGYRPPFDPHNDERSYRWVDAWADWGDPVAPGQERPGDVLVLRSPHHVTLYDGEEGAYYWGLGGNQSDAVNRKRFAKSGIRAIRRPSERDRFRLALPVTGAASASVSSPASSNPALRRRMAAVILSFEARRDAQGRLAVYPLPANDGGGSYEVAGINDRYHPQEAAELREMINAGRHDEAARRAEEIIADYTDVVTRWGSIDPGIEFMLRDCAFNRGPTGAAKILQIALGVDVDGEVGPDTRAALARAREPITLLHKLRDAREEYERTRVGVRPNLWAGMVSRWSKAVVAAQQFTAEAAAATDPQIIPPTPGRPMPDPVMPPTSTPTDPVEACLAELRPVLARHIKAMPTTEQMLAGMLAELQRRSGSGGALPAPAVPADEPAVVAPPVAAPASPAFQKPSVQLSAAGLVLSTVLQMLGVVGTPFGMGEVPTQAGTLATLVPILTGAFGATGGFGTALSVLRTVGGVLGQLGAAAKQAQQQGAQPK